MSQPEITRKRSSRWSGGYQGWVQKCLGRNRECPNHPGVRIGSSGICLVDHLEALAEAGDGPYARHAQQRLIEGGWGR